MSTHAIFSTSPLQVTNSNFLDTVFFRENLRNIFGIPISPFFLEFYWIEPSGWHSKRAETRQMTNMTTSWFRGMGWDGMDRLVNNIKTWHLSDWSRSVLGASFFGLVRLFGSISIQLTSYFTECKHTKRKKRKVFKNFYHLTFVCGTWFCRIVGFCTWIYIKDSRNNSFVKCI